ncbi:carbon-nitrogen hydrolase family protein [Ostreibacterium oceani]|uniref:Carbon-nitrogen hydrolase family protein n=1 Tax=Ostreibacterium oceani TaxID=2654998 RepID=A0A6N7EVL3_9GAMM|nr:carbon-nitrogen hydrolase family protein [Ostreibacterium oceani]MPV86522.1 carbon-nitrogen hydrolase family protein [Ostreibacterium oceani]
MNKSIPPQNIKQNKQQAPIAAVIQLNTQDDVAENIKRIAYWVKRAKEQGAALAVLPENCIYMPKVQGQAKLIAEALGAGHVQSELAGIAKENKLWLIVGAFPTWDAAAGSVKDSTKGSPKDSHKAFQTSLVYNESGKLVAHYHKRHLFDVTLPSGGSDSSQHNSHNNHSSQPKAESYRESDAFLRGQYNQYVDTPIGRIGLTICYDLRFPEQYRALTEQGCALFSIPAAFTHATGAAHWEVLMRARAIENQCYVLASAQTGTHPSGRQTWGHSMIINPWGEVLAVLADGEGVICATIDLPALTRLRAQFPVLTHRQ